MRAETLTARRPTSSAGSPGAGPVVPPRIPTGPSQRVHPSALSFGAVGARCPFASRDRSAHLRAPPAARSRSTQRPVAPPSRWWRRRARLDQPDDGVRTRRSWVPPDRPAGRSRVADGSGQALAASPTTWSTMPSDLTDEGEQDRDRVPQRSPAATGVRRSRGTARITTRIRQRDERGGDEVRVDATEDRQRPGAASARGRPRSRARRWRSLRRAWPSPSRQDPATPAGHGRRRVAVAARRGEVGHPDHARSACRHRANASVRTLPERTPSRGAVCPPTAR